MAVAAMMAAFSDPMLDRVSAQSSIYLPHEVQGAGDLSPLPIGMAITVRGVVTARVADGFFVQTEPGLEDADDTTSEGLFVFMPGGPPAAAQIGWLVQVDGAVAEVSPTDDGSIPSQTELHATAVQDLGAATLPTPFVLTATELSPAGTADQLERFEGMLVAGSLTTVSGTGGVKSEADASATSNGAFFTVLTGQARPFREPGVAPGLPASCWEDTCNVPMFDGNFERLRVDTSAIEGSTALDVPAGTGLNVTGPLGVRAGVHTVLAATVVVVTGGQTVQPAPAPTAGEFTVATLNAERFFDDLDDGGSPVVMTPAAYALRLSKASQLVRSVLLTPDVVGLQEIENVSVLTALAQRIDADAAALGQPAPGYSAVLFEGPDPNGLDIGLLVKTGGGRATLVSSDQVGAGATYLDPSTGQVELLHEHPPVVARIELQAAGYLPQTITVIVNHLRSMSGVHLDNETGARVRAQRRAQAEYLAGLVQTRQLNDPQEAIVVIGDFNAFPFNDGYVDVVATVMGAPTSAEEVLLASPDLVSPNLSNPSSWAPAGEHYSTVADGNAQALDHILVSAAAAGQVTLLSRPRVNADFPEASRGVAGTPARLSDRDPVVAYFALPPDLEAPVFALQPPDVTAAATGPSGAAVTFATPAATDNIDPVVDVTCSPVSGSVFPLGDSPVSCTAQDDAGNQSTVSFVVQVVDTGAPILSVPANMSVTTPDSSGATATFLVVAVDAVDPNPQVTCAPTSGSLFPVGTTTVNCTASDAAGNTSSGSFTVTVVQSSTSTAGHMSGGGWVSSDGHSAWFLFDVRESRAAVERGWVVLHFKDRYGRDRFCAVQVHSVRFSDAPGHAPGRGAGSGIDTVTFSGVGAYNGRRGQRFEITATDRGEPGAGLDTFSVVIRSPHGAVVESVSGVLRQGNIQSWR
jgi:hypothetical protein